MIPILQTRKRRLRGVRDLPELSQLDRGRSRFKLRSIWLCASVPSTPSPQGPPPTLPGKDRCGHKGLGLPFPSPSPQLQGLFFPHLWSHLWAPGMWLWSWCRLERQPLLPIPWAASSSLPVSAERTRFRARRPLCVRSWLPGPGWSWSWTVGPTTGTEQLIPVVPSRAKTPLSPDTLTSTLASLPPGAQALSSSIPGV